MNVSAEWPRTFTKNTGSGIVFGPCCHHIRRRVGNRAAPKIAAKAKRDRHLAAGPKQLNRFSISSHFHPPTP